MNSVVLMAEVLAEPELRYTPENLAVVSTLVSFPNSRPEESPYQVRVAAFGELAQTVTDTCHVGDHILIEGQLHINVVERDGRNEKRAEVNARRIYRVGAGGLQAMVSSEESSGASTSTSTTASKAAVSSRQIPEPTPQVSARPVQQSKSEPDLDDIPF